MYPVAEARIAAGSRGLPKLAFLFDASWAELSKVAVFEREGVVFHTALDAENTCTVPYDMVARAGSFRAGVFGTAEGVRLTTNMVRFAVGEGSFCASTAAEETPPDLWQRILETVAHMETIRPVAKTAAMTQEVGMDASGRLYTAPGGGTYTLPAATADTLGGVKIGSGITAAADGTISVSGGGSAPLPVVYETTLSEAVSTVQISADADGNALSLTEMECYVSIPNTTTASYSIYQYLSVDQVIGAKMTTVANDPGAGVGCVTRYTAGSGYVRYTILKYYIPESGHDYYYDTRKDANIDLNSPVTFVKLQTFGENTIPAGTKIIIRGR